MVGIDLANLPQTIRDAIHVTHALGINFLWTDALCIIQDSPQDKHRELRYMRDVYRHTCFTIDAASAARASEGFLQERQPWRPTLTLPFICPAKSASQLSEIGSLHLEYHDPTADTTAREPAPDYTATRAWCLQEALMSTRGLIFKDNTVQLRCHTTTQNIGGAEHNASTDDLPRLPGFILRPDLNVQRYSEEWKEVRRLWGDVVRHYSFRSLSDPADKLVACAGLAEMFARALGAEYRAGVWDDDYLLRDLLWRCPDYRAVRPQAYRAPSWSWASVDGELQGPHAMPGCAQEYLAEVLRCTAAPLDDAIPFGPVIGGSLVLRAHLFHAFCEVDPGHDEPRVFIEGPSQAQRPIQDFDMFDTKDDENAEDSDLWAVPILREVWEGSGRPERCRGMLLRRAHLDVPRNSESLPADRGQCQRIVFRRVGMFMVEGDTKRDMQALGWDGEWTLDAAAEFEIV
ncbi:hypothetical protein FKP32DRAFT_1586274 [Trametes sanguinea]|nr:hypothetical protein FKP32DRAFT_1586274 [Trametes sanguinea]